MALFKFASGVVTQDSDVFLYGATEVYRNFQMAPGYTCDVYKLSTIEDKLGLSRVKMVALSLLTGCDYNSGIHRVGKETAIKFLKTIPDDQIFKRYIYPWTHVLTYEGIFILRNYNLSEMVSLFKGKY